MKTKNITRYLTLCVLFVGLLGCSDSATDTGTPDPDPPQLPELQSFQPDTDYFNSQNTQTSTQVGTGYELAAQLMQYTIEPLFSSTQVFLPFFSQAKQTEPTYNDGVWEWSYSYSQFEQSADIRLTAEADASGEEYSWDLFISTNTTSGTNFDNYHFMDGITKTDGSEGNWSIYPYDPGGSSNAVVSFDWTREDDANYTASYTIESPETSATFTITYTRADVEHTLTFESSDNEFDSVIYWNSDTGNGSINSATGEKVCWDSSFNDVAC